MNFVKSSNSTSLSGPNVTWTTNPIYQSPEMAGISWYDQVNHWDPHSEGVFSISQASTNDPIPYWTNRESDLSGIRSEWARIEKQSAQNALSQTTPAIPSTSSAPQPRVPIAPLAAAETKGPAKLAQSKDVAKVASAVTGVGNAALSVASLTGPAGIAAAINAAAGAATASAIDAGNKSTIASDYVANTKVQGSQSTHQAQLLKEIDTAHANVTASGAQIGGLFGPVGAWLGGSLANAIQDSSPKDTYSDLKTGYSFEGRFNPQDTGSVNSATTANLSGQTNIQSNI
nr:MAG: hypothetical protein [Polycipiviridae sp.]